MASDNKKSSLEVIKLDVSPRREMAGMESMLECLWLLISSTDVGD